MALAVAVDLLPEMIYPGPRVELGYGPPSDLIVPRGAWASTQRWWLEQDGERVWLTWQLGQPGSLPQPGSRTEVLPGAPHRIGESTVRARALLDRGDPSRRDLALASDPAASGAALAELVERRRELAARVAANVAAPSSLLERLAQCCDRATLEAVAGNPSSPFAAVLRLGPVFPEAFWGNPQVILLLLTDPSFGAMSDYALSSLLSHPAAPIEMVQAFASHPSASVREFVRRALAVRSP